MDGVVRLLRDSGEREAAELREEKERREAKLDEGRAREPPQHELRSWGRRLVEAKRLRDEGVCPMSVQGGILFHPDTGLQKTRSIAYRRGQSNDEVWEFVLHRIRRQETRAREALHAKQRRDVAVEAEEARCLMLPQVRTMERQQRALRLLKGKRGKTAMGTLRVGDSKSMVSARCAPTSGGVALDLQVGRKMEPTEPGYLAELGRVGQAAVRRLDEGCVPKAYEAWCKTFCEPFEELEGLAGGKWELEKELTFELFCDTIECMQDKKSVGAGGFSIELIKGADSRVKRACYNVLMADVRELVSTGRKPVNWGKVLYVLLEKPYPNDPEIAGDRREIALMPQELKLLLRMVRTACHDRISARMLSVQMGWLAGYGHQEPAMAATFVVQQQVRLKGEIWMFYGDLMTFFSKIHREIGTMSSALVGLPE